METDTVIQKFRTSLHGFNRQDVQQYIEQMADVHRQELNLLQKQLEEAQARNAELEEAVSNVEIAKSDAAEEEARARASLETSTQALNQTREELSQTESKLTSAREELERLQAQVDAMGPMAENYAKLKDRVATVELEAHRRAQDTVDQDMAEAEDIRAESERVHAETEQARGEAERIRTEARRWADSVLTQYSQLRRGMDSLIRQARALGQTADQMGPLDKSAQRLQKLVGLDQAKGKP